MHISKLHQKSLQCFANERFEEAILLSSIVSSRLLPIVTQYMVSRGDKRHSICLLFHRERLQAISFARRLSLELGRRNQYDFEFIIVCNGSPDSSQGDDFAEFQHDVIYVDVGFNYGCSGGRNIGANTARGEFIYFFDDDGECDVDAILILAESFIDPSLVAVRGRVVSKSDLAELPPPHYDLGDYPLPSPIDTEGFSCWRRGALLDFGGFSPLLAGHEGLLLSYRVFCKLGPLATVYCPEARMYHDWAESSQGSLDKHERYALNERFFKYLGIDFQTCRENLTGYQRSPNLQLAYQNTRLVYYPLAPRSGGGLDFSILTTVRNGSTYLAQAIESISTQSYRNFEWIVVDDGSTDDTVDKFETLIKGTSLTYRLVTTQGGGRAAALNQGLHVSQSRHIVINDVDDISIPTRLVHLLRYFELHPKSECVGFQCFTNRRLNIASQPHPNRPFSILARLLTGMPVSFPGFAFDRESFSIAFDTNLQAGIDCKWIFDNFSKSFKRGHFIPLPVAYYNIHSDQISSKHRDLQRAQVIKCLRSFFLLNGFPIEVLSERNLVIVSLWEKAHSKMELEDTVHLLNYIVRFSLTFDPESRSDAAEHLAHVRRLIFEGFVSRIYPGC